MTRRHACSPVPTLARTAGHQSHSGLLSLARKQKADSCRSHQAQGALQALSLYPPWKCLPFYLLPQANKIDLTKLYDLCHTVVIDSRSINLCVHQESKTCTKVVFRPTLPEAPPPRQQTPPPVAQARAHTCIFSSSSSTSRFSACFSSGSTWSRPV